MAGTPPAQRACTRAKKGPRGQRPKKGGRCQKQRAPCPRGPEQAPHEARRGRAGGTRRPTLSPRGTTERARATRAKAAGARRERRGTPGAAGESAGPRGRKPAGGRAEKPGGCPDGAMRAAQAPSGRAQGEGPRGGSTGEGRKRRRGPGPGSTPPTRQSPGPGARTRSDPAASAAYHLLPLAEACRSHGLWLGWGLRL